MPSAANLMQKRLYTTLVSLRFCPYFKRTLTTTRDDLRSPKAEGLAEGAEGFENKTLQLQIL